MNFYQNILFSDLDLFMEQTRSWNLDFRQMDNGSFKATLIQYGVNTAQIGIGSFNRKFDQRGSAPAGLISFALLDPDSPPIIWRGVEVDQNTVMVYRPGDEINCSSGPNFKVLTYSICEQSFLKWCHDLGHQETVKRIRHQRTLPINHQKKHKILETIVQTNHMAARCCNECEKEIIENILDFELSHLFINALAESVGEVARSPLTDRSVKALRAIEHSLLHAIPPPTKVRELCEMTGVSERSLQNLIMWKYGMTPMAYLRHARLNYVRKMLYHATPGTKKVSDAANRMGFWHMGQFAKDYHQLFGELPSETLHKI